MSFSRRASRCSASAAVPSLINVALGGSLYQDIATQLPEAISHVADAYDRHMHDIVLEAGGLLEKRLGSAAQRQVISIHHQGIRTLGRELVVEARRRVTA